MSEFWQTTPEWRGQTCAVLASGPSMSAEVCAVVRAAGVRTIAVNNQAIRTKSADGRVHEPLAPWADILYAADSRWWCENKRAVRDFPGIKATIQPNSGAYPCLPVEDVRVLRNGGPRGCDPRQGYIRTGHNSGYQALMLAIDLGAARIVLCGFDLHGRNGEHWFGDHAWRPRYGSRYELFVRAFNEGAKEILQRADVINATPGSALKCFRSMPLEEALYGLQDMHQGAGISADAGSPQARGAGAENDRAEAAA